MKEVISSSMTKLWQHNKQYHKMADFWQKDFLFDKHNIFERWREDYPCNNAKISKGCRTVLVKDNTVFCNSADFARKY